MQLVRYWLCVAILLALAACGHSESPATAPATGTAPSTPVASAGGPRIVSTVPAATFNLVLIGAADCLVGVSPYDKVYLPEAKQGLPVVGDYQGVNYEVLVGLKPTALILQTAEAHIPARLRELAATHHFQIINIKLDTTEDLWATVKELGKAVGREDAAATAILKAQAELKSMAAPQAGKDRPKVVYVFSKNPLQVIGSHNFMNEVLTLAGADNVAAKIDNPFPIVSSETLAALAPEVLLISAPSEPEQQRDDPRLEFWRRLPIPAAKNNRIFLVTDGDALTASVNLPKSVRALSALIHQEAPAGEGGGTASPAAGEKGSEEGKP